MKTIRLVISVFLSFIFFNLNAQMFIGGNLGFSTSGGNIDNGGVTVDKPTTTSFNITPMVGKFFSDNLALGLDLNISVSSASTPGPPKITDNSTTIGVTPFLRYYALRVDKFSVFGQVNVGFSSTTTKTKTGSVSSDGPKTTSFFLNVFPGLAYDISNKLALETNINILNFGFNDTMVKTGTNKNKTTTFGLGAGLDDIVTVGSITIGAIYKF